MLWKPGAVLEKRSLWETLLRGEPPGLWCDDVGLGWRELRFPAPSRVCLERASEKGPF